MVLLSGCLVVTMVLLGGCFVSVRWLLLCFYGVARCCYGVAILLLGCY